MGSAEPTRRSSSITFEPLKGATHRDTPETPATTRRDVLPFWLHAVCTMGI